MDETTVTSTEKTSLRQKPRWGRILAWVGLFALLIVVAMVLLRKQQGPVAIGQTPPAFRIITFDGQKIGKSQMEGKVVLINFWASWCKPCEQEAADLEAAWQHYKPGGKVVFLGVDWVDTEPEAKAYLDRFNITYTNGPDLRTAISQIFRIKGVPETYILDQNGHLARIVDENGNQLNPMIGPYTSVTQIQNAIDRLLK